ncbi:MAG: sulfatase-like hydrolase/transferase [Rhodococcus sp. (in: high G+C Gram-positive bacteria)]|uniref:sulfatase-like hydrolase/transferase n=1 Tax=Rhodococcus sp. TaxID=1831 RepID=UPI002ADA40C0|nr:sulfatase-like hydrolase/transferase [Rhodococcus sp. (in: high G+C Gram-positive bacteria)]
MFNTHSGGRVSQPVAGLSLCASAVLTATVGCSGVTTPPDASSTTSAPNILMVLLDDLGYADLGAYGGPVDTEAIDSLAASGAQFTDFHAYPVCAPTRAALMTGQDPHRVGLGSMEALIAPGVSKSTPGYKGSLEGEFTSIAQVLSDTGYDTYQAGKWHLGQGENQTPRDLGFDRNFTMYQGGASYYSDAHGLSPNQVEPVDQVTYERDGERVETLPDDFYATEAYTDDMIGMIDSGLEDDRPFFGYLAYTAPHDPLHVPDPGLIDKYLDMYLDNNNYNELRASTIRSMADKGLIGADVDTRWPSQVPDWNSLSGENKLDLAYRLAVYSAMIEYADTQIGRVLDHVKQRGVFDNTLVVVASDNGASGISPEVYTLAPGPENWMTDSYPSTGDIEAYGEPGSFPTLALSNAQISSGPYFHTKASVFEGGHRVPLIVKTPTKDGEAPQPRVVDTLTHISDLYPTFADYAGAQLVQSDRLFGDSAKPLLDGSSVNIGDDVFGLELFGERAIRDGNSKLVFAAPASGGTGSYALYDLEADPGETNDLADDNPAEVQRLARLWDEYAAQNNVIAADFQAVNAAMDRVTALEYSMDWAE